MKTMREIPVPEAPDLLTAQECADLVGITREDWSLYVTRDVAPQPHQAFGHPPVWDRNTVSTWQQTRQGHSERRRTRA